MEKENSVVQVTNYLVRVLSPFGIDLAVDNETFIFILGKHRIAAKLKAEEADYSRAAAEVLLNFLHKVEKDVAPVVKQ